MSAILIGQKRKQAQSTSGAWPYRKGRVTSITLSFPKAGSGSFYALLEGWLIGPTALLGEEIYDQISFRSPDDQIRESRGWCRENHVTHHALEAFVQYEPNFDRARPTPSQTYPQAIRYDYYRPNGIKVLNEQAAYGIGISGATASIITPTKLYYSACEWFPPNRLVVYEVEAIVSHASSYCDELRQKEYTYVSNSGESARFNVIETLRKTTSTPATRAGNWSYLRSFEDLKAIVLANVGTTKRYWSVYAIRQTSVTALSAIPQMALQAIDDAAGHFLAEDFPLKGKHYGDLAMKASEKLNANSVNMLEFLRDLRHPEQLIPKLKNLSKLKTAAGNYLGYHYGVMPTMSDLKEIFQALVNRRPHFDLFGYRTTDSSHFVSGSINNVFYELEQHIKVAVHSEDSGLGDLITRLESVGIFPTLENLWDLVPYSFVVDWFLDVGGFLERVDTRLRLARFTIPYVTLSFKESSSVNLSPTREHPYSGTVKRKVYQRWVTSKCPVPPLSLSQSPSAVSHWLEAGALVITRAK